MFPILVIAIGIVVLVFGKRLSVLGAAVGALLGVALVSLFPGGSDPFTLIIVPLLLGVIGFFAVGFAKGIINIVLLVLGVLAGAAIVLGFLELFTLQLGLLGWFLVAAGGVAGFILVQRFKDWAVLILAGLIGGLLVTRGSHRLDALPEWSLGHADHPGARRAGRRLPGRVPETGENRQIEPPSNHKKARGSALLYV